MLSILVIEYKLAYEMRSAGIDRMSCNLQDYQSSKWEEIYSELLRSTNFVETFQITNSRPGSDLL